MPNWCTTDIVGTNSDPELIRGLKSEFDNAFHWAEIENGFGEMWLGNILGYLGYTEKEIVYGDMKCRGEVTDIELRNDTVLYIGTFTAWVPMFTPFVKMIEKYAPGSEITYYAEELGCEILCTNDLDMVGKIKVIADSDVPSELSWIYEADEYDMDKTMFLEKIRNSMKWEIPLEKVEEKIETDLAGLFSYYEWEFADVTEW